MAVEFKRFEFVALCKHARNEISDLRKRCLTRHTGIHILAIDVAGSHGHSWHMGKTGNKGIALVNGAVTVHQWVLCYVPCADISILVCDPQ